MTKGGHKATGGSGKAEGLADGFSIGIERPSASWRLPLPPGMNQSFLRAP